ncbi:hypothetical protein [Lichenicoccus sp.]|uniref:hypothetical protein n=1 Tax=Lichenicoccus sp. TaxID=2781899 RepID=UPI003D0D05FB
MSEQMEAVAAMQFKVGNAVRACRDIPPNVEKGDIGFVVAVYAEKRDYVVDFGHGPLNDLRVEEDAVMAVIDEPGTVAPADPLAGFAEPAPPAARTGSEASEGKALTYLKTRLLSNFSGDPGHIATYRMALTDMLEAVYNLRYIPPVEAWFKPIDPSEQAAVSASRQAAPAWAGSPGGSSGGSPAVPSPGG